MTPCRLFVTVMVAMAVMVGLGGLLAVITDNALAVFIPLPVAVTAGYVVSGWAHRSMP